MYCLVPDDDWIRLWREHKTSRILIHTGRQNKNPETPGISKERGPVPGTGQFRYLSVNLF